MKFLWITDPWSTLDHSQDTTLRLMQEAINMGLPTFWAPSDQLFLASHPEKIQAIELKNSVSLLAQEQFHWGEYSLSNFHQIHDRVDPPVDENYCKIVDLLLSRGASEKQIFNPPHLIKNQSEKIPPPDLSHYAPRLYVAKSENDAELLYPMFKNDLSIVSKPLHLAQSIGVKKHVTPKSELEWKKLLAGLTQNFSESVLIEEYLPEIDQGEVRLWFAGKHFIAALKKYPKAGDFRVLIDEGSRVGAHTLNRDEQSIAKEIGASLERQGILLAAIDLIGHKICDYNITSPGLLVQLEKVHGNKNFAREIMTVISSQAP